MLSFIHGELLYCTYNVYVAVISLDIKFYSITQTYFTSHNFNLKTHSKNHANHPFKIKYCINDIL
jgi:hypothetical protein